MKKRKFEYYKDVPVHYIVMMARGICGSGWLNGTNIEEDVTCPECSRLLTMRAADLPITCPNCKVVHDILKPCFPMEVLLTSASR